MTLEALRQEVWKCNLELPKNGLVKMTSGNVSARDPETGLVVIKPSGYSYEDLTPADMVIVNLAGEVIEGHLKPSVDTATHLYVYRHRPDVFGVAHTHSPYATSFAALGQPIPACLTTTAMMGGEVPVGGYVSDWRRSHWRRDCAENWQIAGDHYAKSRRLHHWPLGTPGDQDGGGSGGDCRDYSPGAAARPADYADARANS